jgi:hypothetical protein
MREPGNNGVRSLVSDRNLAFDTRSEVGVWAYREYVGLRAQMGLMRLMGLMGESH